MICNSNNAVVQPKEGEYQNLRYVPVRVCREKKISRKGQLCRDQAAAVGNLEETQEHLGHSDKNRRQRCEASHTVITPWKEQDPAFSFCL